MISQIPDREGKSPASRAQNFDGSRFASSMQIPFPAKIFCVFPNPTLYFGQIPDPENPLSDPARLVISFELA